MAYADFLSYVCSRVGTDKILVELLHISRYVCKQSCLKFKISNKSKEIRLIREFIEPL